MNDHPAPERRSPAYDSEAARDGRNETEAVRLDRNYGELLQELRVSETGVQVLFAFLLSIPFQQRFLSIDRFERAVYVLTLVFCTIAVALLVAPVAFHRLTFRLGLKDELVRAASFFALAGTSFLLLSVLSGVLLVLDFVSGTVAACLITGVLALVFGALWIALPLARRRRLERAADEAV